MDAYGTEGTLVATSDQMVEMVDPVLMGAKHSDPALSVILPPKDLRWVPSDIPDGVPVNMGQMFRRFAESIREGQSVHPDFQEAARRHHTLDQISLANEQKNWVHF